MSLKSAYIMVSLTPARPPRSNFRRGNVSPGDQGENPTESPGCPKTTGCGFPHPNGKRVRHGEQSPCAVLRVDSSFPCPHFTSLGISGNVVNGKKPRATVLSVREP